MVGQLLKALAIDPVVFKLASDAAKMVTAESKMFSIYSDGIVSGYHRKTRVRVHTVVDFRTAPPPDAGIVSIAGTAASGTGGAAAVRPPGTGIAGAGGAGGASGQSAITSVMAPNPGGTIVYYRME
jgi:hypothetical protein